MKEIINIKYIIIALLVFNVHQISGQKGGLPPAVSIIGPTASNQNEVKAYSAFTGTATVYAATWSVSGGTIQSQTNTSANILWDVAGTGQITYNVTSSSAGAMQAMLSVTVTAMPAPDTPPSPTIISQNCTSAILQNSGSIPSGEMWYWQGTTKKGTDTSYPATSNYTATSSGIYKIRALNTITNVWSTLSGTVTVTLGTVGGTSWYADTDGDGLGDPNVSIVQCTQPTGYVANDHDQCPATNGQGSTNGCLITQSLSNENYIYTIAAQKATTNIESLIQNERDSTLESVTYFDGFGRPKQKIAIRQSPASKDIVTHIEYDAFGRQAKSYLPYTSTQGDGMFKASALNLTSTYYNTNYASDIDVNNPNPYSEKVLENSPLGRVFEQTAPGKDWIKTASLVPGKAYSDGHTIKTEYHTNIVNEVNSFVVTLSFANNTYTPTLSGGTTYHPAGSLSKTVIKDENWTASDGANRTTEEFKNRLGQLVLKRTYALISTSTPEAHDTYYVYDVYGNLSYVIPPKVNVADGVSTDELNKLCYQYVYDHKNRLVEKKIPGKGWEYIIYDKHDRPILTQDALQRNLSQWLFTKYDIFGRVAYTGIFAHATPGRVYWQDHASLYSYQDEERIDPGVIRRGTLIYYTSRAFPQDYSEIITINYYDDYTYDMPSGVGGPDTLGTVYGETPTTNVKELPTGTKIRVLGTDDWITNISYYDQKSRLIYTHTHNAYLGTTDIVKLKLGFTGKIVETTSLHTNINDTGLGTQMIVDHFDFDHAERLLEQRQTINGGSNTEVIVSNSYGPLGQLKTKGVGGKTTQNRLQTVDYSYNIRGWLTNINNDVHNDNDLFNFNIKYNDITDVNKKLFNGNISQTSWNTLNTDSSTKTYTYSYDALNRIKSGISNNSNYDLSSVSYDKNGNILNLIRRGHTDTNATTFGDMDNLSYSYDANSNRLIKVADAAPVDGFGFKDDAVNTTVDTADDYVYDVNGNMVKDFNKEILGLNGADGILYNHLNLPTKVIFNPHVYTNKNIEYVYDATGVKLRKTVNDGGAITTTDYAGNFIYKDSKLEFFNHAEGYVKHTNSNGYEYIYQYKDHLGNVRLSYADSNDNGVITVSTDPNTNELIDESNYYPFGLKQRGYNETGNTVNGNSVAQKKMFGGKEYNDELGLNWYDFHARNYDDAIGRWMNLDPHSDNYYDSTPYAYGLNNPLYFVDPDGKDNIVYLVLLESADSKQWKKIADATNERFKKLGLETRVQIYSGKEMFDSKNLDSTDSFGIIGSSDEISKLFDEHAENFKGISSFRGSSKLKDPTILEFADRDDDGSGTGFIIKTETLDKAAKYLKTNSTDMASYLAMHALGHNANRGHNANGSTLMASGGRVAYTMRGGYVRSEHGGAVLDEIPGVSSFNDLFKPSLNKDYSESIRKRMGTNKAKDNYSKNKKRRNRPIIRGHFKNK